MTPSLAIDQALGLLDVNLMEYCEAFNNRTFKVMENAPANDAHDQREPHICVQHHDVTDIVVVQEVGRFCVRIGASWTDVTPQ